MAVFSAANEVRELQNGNVDKGHSDDRLIYRNAYQLWSNSEA